MKIAVCTYDERRANTGTKSDYYRTGLGAELMLGERCARLRNLGWEAENLGSPDCIVSALETGIARGCSCLWLGLPGYSGEWRKQLLTAVDLLSKITLYIDGPLCENPHSDAHERRVKALGEMGVKYISKDSLPLPAYSR